MAAAQLHAASGGGLAGVPGDGQPPPLQCSMLLELPTPELEAAFWKQQRTLKAYTMWDVFAVIYTLVGTLLIGKALAPALAPRSSGTAPHPTCHLAIALVVSVAACLLTLWMMLRHPKAYARHRHRVVLANRLLRLAIAAAAALLASPGLGAAVGDALTGSAAARGHRSEVFVAVLHLTRPLIMVPLMLMTQGNWVLKAKLWLPMQLLNYCLAAFGSWRHIPCSLAADPHSAQLLPGTCRSLTSLHAVILGSITGPAFVLPSSATPNGSGSVGGPAAAACDTIVGAAHVLTHFCMLAYGVVILSAGFFRLEWRLKAAFVRQETGRQLAYGPFGWPCSGQHQSTRVFTLHRAITWCLAVPALMALLWHACLLVVPLLPQQACHTCEDLGTCHTYEPCDGLWCQAPALWAAVIIYVEVLSVVHGHLVTLEFM